MTRAGAIDVKSSKTEKKSHYSESVNHVTDFAKTMPSFSAGQTDKSEISNLKICIVIDLPRVMVQ